MRSKRVSILSTLRTYSLPAALALTAFSVDAEPRPKIGLALSGGGARGIAHVGVLRALEEHDIRVDYLVGTSMGAVVGALYASGYSTERLLEIVRSIDWERIFSGEPDRRLVPLSRRLQETPPVLRLAYDLWRIHPPSAVLSDYRIQRTLTRFLAAPNLHAGGNFDRLSIPFRAVAADIRTGERVVLSEGNLGRAVRASMSIPVAFSPVPWNDYLLVDGGIADNLPVEVVQEMGADVVIAVDISSPTEPDAEDYDVFGIANRLTDLLISTRNVARRVPADVTIRPDLDGHSFMNYTNLDFLVERGYLAAIESMDELSRWANAGGNAPRSQGSAQEDGLDGKTVGEVRLFGNQYVPDELIARDFRIEPGEPFDLGRALGSMDRVFASGFFESVWLELDPHDRDRIGVRLHVEEMERRIAEIGLSYNESDEAGAFIRLNNRSLLGWGEQEQLLVHASDRASGVQVRLLRPRSLFGWFGFELTADVREGNPKRFRGDEFINRAEFDRKSIGVAAHLPFGRTGLARAGFRAEDVDVGERPGLDFGPANEGLRVFHVSLNADNLDHFYAPREGTAFSVLVEKNVGGDDLEDNYWRFLFRARRAFSLGETSALEGRAFVGLTGRRLPISEQLRIGGPDLLAGFQREQLWGEQALAFSVAYRFFVNRNLSLVARATAGNTWANRNDITFDSLRGGVGWGVQYDSPVGPIRFDVGFGDDGQSQLYFAAGFY